jgi:two-component system phosphate regulon sensor histidine kinase PhoR
MPDRDSRPSVWIVDDSPLDAERARRALGASYAVEVFADGSAMLEQLMRGPGPCVLVLDWVMPGVSGIEVCQFLRSGSMVRPQLAILLLTMQSHTQQIVEGLAAGANDYLVKPYADPELLARVDALVRSNSLLERAQAAEASVAELLEHAPDPLIGVDAHHDVTYVNEEAQRALDKNASALVGRPLSEVLPGLSGDHLRDAARTSRPLPDITIADQVFSPSIRSLPGDNRAALTVALRDVTAHRKRESRRLDFYSIIAHDLRSPLSAMLMRTDSLLRGRRGVLSAEVVTDLRKMDGHMRRLMALINDFLDFARMEEGAHAMQRAHIDLGELASEIVDDFRPLAENAGQELRIEVLGERPLVLGDRQRLQQVLTNLVANAVKFTLPGGHITVRAQTVAALCEVVVEDDGPGIAAETLPTLFQRYSRAPNGPADVGGTGLGLLIVREIIEAHGGSVGVDSTPGQGSRFWFRIAATDAGTTLPRVAAAAAR